MVVTCGFCHSTVKDFGRHQKTMKHKILTGHFDMEEFMRVNKIHSQADLKRVLNTPFTGRIRTIRAS